MVAMLDCRTCRLEAEMLVQLIDFNYMGNLRLVAAYWRM